MVIESEDGMPGENSETLTTIENAFEILEWVLSNSGATPAQIANQLDVSTSTAHRYLNTLSEEGYLVREDRTYYLALKFLALGEQARTRKETYVSAEEYTHMLAEESGCRSTFIVEEGGRGIYLYTAPGKHSVWTRSTIGKRIPLHATAGGKALLAFLPQEKVDRIIKTGLERQTAETITSPQRLRETIETIRERGYAFNREEQIDGVNAVGAPVMSDGGDVIGAFSVSGPSNRLRGDRFTDELPQILLGITNEYELRVSLS
ncbi:IclR family transcriptional regulator [Halocalculus aciditolerans]|uniref:IclR family transcriptional regulator n=1 Tax=Halocalculus aciditolerans TaxID=1383812 RepID=A0A830FE44_9EURY|nr:IclR family transcriptional regulator [Halocalculus aciditolerans]GGL66136.1 IclR family transcriptional regulator [Halocalculus aciditolerans]